MKKRLLLLAAAGLIAARRHLKAPYDLHDKVVLITGGSRGLGLALAREFGAQGAKLALLARDEAELARAAEDLRARGAEVLTVRADVTDEAAASRAVEATVAHYGGLDVLVNNAGTIVTGPVQNQSAQDYRHAMDVNLFGPIHMMLAARPYLSGRRGRLLNIASVGGRVPVPHLASYVASKFALVGLGQVWTAELARDGITVTTVNPSLMQTGSPRQIQIKGQHQKEYALFAALDHLPGLSMDAAQAARAIVLALKRGDPQANIGVMASLAATAQALAPNLITQSMALGARFLPAPTASDERRTGAESETQATRKIAAKTAAEREYNQLG